MANCAKCALWEFDIRAIVFEQGSVHTVASHSCLRSNEENGEETYCKGVPRTSYSAWPV